jgi:probable DNA metabolism protein
MPSDTWLIHDVRRRLAIHWDRKELAWVDPEDLPPENPELAEDEGAYQFLWQTYFRNIAVTDRRNPRLQRQYMPARYWKHLVEVPGGG